MGLKGYRLWVNLIQRAAPHRGGCRRREGVQGHVDEGGDAARRRGVALQVVYLKGKF
jgi:hypothetical protein